MKRNHKSTLFGQAFTSLRDRLKSKSTRRRTEAVMVQSLVDTLRSPGPALPGDWIVTLPNGDEFVCKKYVFEDAFARAMQEGQITDGR
jgi:hypothetical protein